MLERTPALSRGIEPFGSAQGRLRAAVERFELTKDSAECAGAGGQSDQMIADFGMRIADQ